MLSYFKKEMKLCCYLQSRLTLVLSRGTTVKALGVTHFCSHSISLNTVAFTACPAYFLVCWFVCFSVLLHHAIHMLKANIFMSNIEESFHSVLDCWHCFVMSWGGKINILCTSLLPGVQVLKRVIECKDELNIYIFLHKKTSISTLNGTSDYKH